MQHSWLVDVLDVLAAYQSDICSYNCGDKGIMAKLLRINTVRSPTNDFSVVTAVLIKITRLSIYEFTRE